MPLIARLVLGRHWRAASEPQRTAYLDAFRVYALDSLAYRFARLGGGVGFQLLGRCVADGSDALIPTEVTLPSRPDPVRIDWRVREADGAYRLIDVAVEGVSLVVSNRSEFDSVVSRQGLDALISPDPRQGREPLVIRRVMASAPIVRRSNRAVRPAALGLQA